MKTFLSLSIEYLKFELEKTLLSKESNGIDCISIFINVVSIFFSSK